MKIQKIISLLLMSVIITSCVSDVDFNQVDDISIQPIVKSSILYFNATTNDFIDPITNDPITFISDTTDMRLFDSSLAQEDVTKIVLKFNIENTFNKNFNLEYIFFNEANEVITSIPFNIINNNILEQEISYENGDLQNLLSAKKIAVIATIEVNQDSTTPSMFLNFQSAADSYFNIVVNEN
ncbi:MAG: hypothetical protein L3J23_10010 [Flavobacteriaceae bacterium]|nr:hypothetical protein [Flavobacteriaceae bacterium]